MIYIVDNFLSKELLDEFLNDKSDFIEHRYPDKSFWVKMPSEKFNQYVINENDKKIFYPFSEKRKKIKMMIGEYIMIQLLTMTIPIGLLFYLWNQKILII